jgi:hypothetical protein
MKTLAFIFFFLTLSAAAQLPLGTVTDIQPTACTEGFVGASTCHTATVSCPGVSDVAVTFGTKGNPAVGTIVFINGTGDTMPGGAPFFFQIYSEGGFSLAQFIFATDWEDGGNVLASACRPATILNFLRSTPSLPFCVQGASGGAGATAYALSWYGIPIDNAELLSGPVFSDIALGCRTPHAVPITVNPTNGSPFEDDPIYNQESSQVSAWTATSCLPRSSSTNKNLGSEVRQSIVQAGAVLSFPATNLSGWVCDNGENPSAAQAYLWFSQVTTPWNLTSISNCQGSEGVAEGVTPQGTTGSQAIADDMLAKCVKPQ